MRWRNIFLQVLWLTFLVFAGGCFSSNVDDIQAFLRPERTSVITENYILQPPDEIEVYSSKIPELHLQRQRIRPDGKVSFESLGEIHAAGKTPKQLADQLQERIVLLYALTGDNPIDVRVAVFKSKFYYVLGQVYHEGRKIASGHDTVLSALAEARPTVLGWIERVQVVRPSADENVKAKIFEVNYHQIIEHGDLSKNVLLDEGDIVYVPATVLASIGMVIEEAFRPIGRAFSAVNIVQNPIVN